MRQWPHLQCTDKTATNGIRLWILFLDCRDGRFEEGKEQGNWYKIMGSKKGAAGRAGTGVGRSSLGGYFDRRVEVRLAFGSSAGAVVASRLRAVAGASKLMYLSYLW